MLCEYAEDNVSHVGQLTFPFGRFVLKVVFFFLYVSVAWADDVLIGDCVFHS